MTTFDGYPMTEQGKAGRAIGLGIVASFFCGDMIGVVMEIMALLQLSQPEVQEWMTLQDV